jgi:two-component system response regulator WspF
MTMRIAIVNDLAMAREALRRAVAAMPDATVAWTANDGADAIAKTERDRPDLILMDLIMPGTDGVDATREIMRRCPCAIVVVTATVEGNASRVYEAIGAGALDAVDTPRIGSDGGAATLARKVEEVRRMRAGGHGCGCTPPIAARGPVAASTRSPAVAIASTEACCGAPSTGGAAPARTAAGASAGSTVAPAPPASTAAPIVAIGASTGGPQALAAVLEAMPLYTPFTTLVVQHMEAPFLPGFAAWLGERTGRAVRLARAGDRLEAGAILVAGEPRQLVVTRCGTPCYVDGPPDLVHKPSVDVLFHSLAESGVEPGVAVLLTGMGRDGARGLLALRRGGWATIAQDSATSIVWGMPGAAVDLNAAERVLPLGQIGAALVAEMSRRRAERMGGTR